MDISYAFEKLMLFRRMIVFMMCVFTLIVTWWSLQLAMYLGSHSMNGTDIVAVMIAMQAPITALTGYLFKLYDKQRSTTDAANS